MVPPYAVHPLFKQVVNEFINDRSSTEAIVVGLNFVREICLRMPLLMTKDLLEDLVLYKKSHEKQISTAARSLVLLFREVCPSLLVKKDRGCFADANARPRAFGEVNVAGVPGLELLQSDDDKNSEDDESGYRSSDNEGGAGFDNEHYYSISTDDEPVRDDENDNRLEDEADELSGETGESDGFSDIDDMEAEEAEPNGGYDIDEDEQDKEKLNTRKRKFFDIEEQLSAEGARKKEEEAGSTGGRDINEDKQARKNGEKKAAEFNGGYDIDEDEHDKKNLCTGKRKCSDIDEQLSAEGASLQAEAKANKKMPTFKMPDAEQLRRKRVDPATLQAKKKLSKEQKLELVRAGREERGKYQARAAVKQKKTGGLRNRQKAKEKAMPLAARRVMVARSRQEKKRKLQRAGKQFRGRKAWK